MISEVYVKECLKKATYAYDPKHDDLLVFWPVLASCHYSRSVIEWYQQIAFNFVSKNINPRNVLQLHPIEKFWASMKCELCKKDKIVADINQLKFEVWHQKIL